MNYARKMRIEAIETEIARIQQLPKEVQIEMGFDWHLQCLGTELKALKATEGGANDPAPAIIGNGLFARTKAARKTSLSSSTFGVRFA